MKKQINIINQGRFWGDQRIAYEKDNFFSLNLSVDKIVSGCFKNKRVCFYLYQTKYTHIREFELN